MKPIELKDFLNYRFLSGLRYAPEGGRAAFAVSVANEESNSYDSCLWLYENGSLRQLTSLGREKTFWWLDSHRLIFPAARTEAEKKQAETGVARTNLYCLDVLGGEALPWLTLPFAVSIPLQPVICTEGAQTARSGFSCFTFSPHPFRLFRISILSICFISCFSLKRNE